MLAWEVVRVERGVGVVVFYAALTFYFGGPVRYSVVGCYLNRRVLLLAGSSAHEAGSAEEGQG